MPNMVQSVARLHAVGAPSEPESPVPKIRRRNRLINSCLECRRRKLKCDKHHPCLNCSKTGRHCIFIGPAVDAASQSKLTEIKEKVGSLERALERDIARRLGSNRSRRDDAGYAVGDVGDDDADEDAELEPTDLAVNDAAYEDDADDDLFDLGIQIGRLKITERIGGLFRPKLAEELGRHVGAEPDDYRTTGGQLQTPTTDVSASALGPLIYPRAEYFAPSPGFLFGISPSDTSLVTFLPTKAAADVLVAQYFAAVHPIAQALHRPSFERLYRRFWASVHNGVETTASIEAVMMAVMMSSAISMTEDTVLATFGVGKSDMVNSLRVGCEQALSRARFLRSSKVETLQALVIYLIPLCRDQVSRTHSAMVGTAIRIAQCIGLHRDGEHYGLSPVEVHVRRLIWYQLCFLDLRTCETQGPHPTIRASEFDTKLPFNMNDVEVENCPPGSLSPARWTDATFSLIRFECNEMMRCIWRDRPRLDKKQISLTAVLSKIEDFRKSMEERYGRIIDERVPIQKTAKAVLGVLLSRLYVMVLHRYHKAGSQEIPDRLRQIIITKGLEMLEKAIQLETDPASSTWAWYSGTYQQYHTALLLLSEVSSFPMRREADRIWKCCDYVFGVDAQLPRHEKSRLIYARLSEASAVYHKQRKVRAPKSMGNPQPLVLTPVEDPRSTESPMHTLPQIDLRTHYGHNHHLPDAAADFLAGQAEIQQYSGDIGDVVGDVQTSSFGLPDTGVLYQIAAAPAFSAAPVPPLATAAAAAGAAATTAAAAVAAAPAPLVTNNNNSYSLPFLNSQIYIASAGPVGTTGFGGYDLGPPSSGSFDFALPEIDWNEWNTLFPPDINNGQLDNIVPLQ